MHFEAEYSVVKTYFKGVVVCRSAAAVGPSVTSLDQSQNCRKTHNIRHLFVSDHQQWRS